jgi:hypothetical protein
VTEQVPDVRVQPGGEKVPPTVSWKLTVPVGVIWVPPALSWTVTVQVVLVVGGILLGLQLTLTETDLGVTWTLTVPDPPPCTASPGYVAAIVVVS